MFILCADIVAWFDDAEEGTENGKQLHKTNINVI